jgi:predicted  nucleic acid-binding Zn-ribbon protein
MSIKQKSNGTGTSPPRKSCLKQKEELSSLNNRFRSNIEQARTLKESNLKYEHELSELKEKSRQELEAIKKSCEVELSAARTLIDENAKESARLELIASKNASLVKELETKLVPYHPCM